MIEKQATTNYRSGWLTLQWALLSGTSLMAFCEATEIKRLRVLKDATTGEEQETIFKDIWEAEAFLAEKEAERLLTGDIFSPGSFPPTPQPTDSPISSPPATFAPVPVAPTAQPTLDPLGCLAGRTREQYLFDQLSLISDSANLLNPTTPEGQAFSFMNNDPLNPNVCSYPIEQRFGLATLYYSTQGDTWVNNQGWLGALEECNWEGLLCNDGILVSNMTLPNNNLRGSLPEEISGIYAMTQMLLSENSLTSSIPVGISNMTELCVLDLEMNLLFGPPIPDQVLVLPKLKQLLLSDNIFENEQLPNEIGVLTDLTDLWLSTNAMEGSMPTSLGTLTALQTLFLAQNEFGGPVPSEIGLLTAMTNLQLYENLFTQIPDQLYNLQQLSVLRINRNFISGTISPNLGNLGQLVDLRYDENFFRGNVPVSLSQLSALEVVSFAVNRLSGPIPDVFSPFSALQIVDFSSNTHSGPLPATLFSLNAIRLIYLNNNELSGALPAAYGNPPLLEDLFLGNNLLSGPVPALSAGQLPQLSEFTLQANAFTGTVPASVCSLRTAASLSDLFADCGGPAPEILCDFPTCCTRCFQDV